TQPQKLISPSSLKYQWIYSKVSGSRRAVDSPASDVSSSDTDCFLAILFFFWITLRQC
ncbi:hypothetical protein HAX54_034562, partial [Datura stramonium]|nr:hypothetical protein [Datura stramonium]